MKKICCAAIIGSTVLLLIVSTGCRTANPKLQEVSILGHISARFAGMVEKDCRSSSSFYI